jgi:hypothetical protein
LAVREHAGHTTKFSAAYTVTADSRDPAELVPQRGMLAVGTIEHAGLLGDCSFLRIAPRLQVGNLWNFDLYLTMDLVRIPLWVWFRIWI